MQIHEWKDSRYIYLSVCHSLSHTHTHTPSISLSPSCLPFLYLFFSLLSSFSFWSLSLSHSLSPSISFSPSFSLYLYLSIYLPKIVGACQCCRCHIYALEDLRNGCCRLLAIMQDLAYRYIFIYFECTPFVVWIGKTCHFNTVLFTSNTDYSICLITGISWLSDVWYREYYASTCWRWFILHPPPPKEKKKFKRKTLFICCGM